MNYLWEAAVEAVIEKKPPSMLRYQAAKDFSPYMELSMPCINQTRLNEITCIEINLYYRFYHVFKDLLAPEQEEFPALTAGIVNLIVHLLAENDILSGMNRKEYYMQLLRKEFALGYFGEESRDGLSLFCRDEQEAILSSLLRQYETGSSLDIFKDMVHELIDESIVYRSNDDFHQILVYVGQTEEAAGRKIRFLIRMFVELPYHTEIYYEHHFGIMGVDCTMELGDMTLC